ncbi:MAG: hypothetical protein ACI86H_003084, partial [bacterium]
LGFFKKGSDDGQVMVELKAPDSKELDEASSQLWKYLEHSNAKWGIVTNFNEVRFYNFSQRASKYQTFYFDVPEKLLEKKSSLKEKKELLKFIYLLKKDHLLCFDNNPSVTEKLLTVQREEEIKIENEFYLKYKQLRIELINEIEDLNPVYKKNKPETVNLAQKILDRFIFVWFCEDSREQLIPENLLTRMIESASKDEFIEEYDIWNKILSLFTAVDRGGAYGINFGFNGELFKPDKRIDNLKLSNSFITGKIYPIGKVYDFGHEQELSVNILGHIFEQSISDLEELKSEMKIDVKQGKRKRDGVFYTPEYITHYIVEQTIGDWLQEQKKRIGFEELPALDERILIKARKKKWGTGKTGNFKKNIRLTKEIKSKLEKQINNDSITQKLSLMKDSFKSKEDLNNALNILFSPEEYTEYSNIILQFASEKTKDAQDFDVWAAHLEFWEKYREILTGIKVLDPACGSGAFLVQTFNFLHAQGENVNMWLEELTGELTILDLDKGILENNIYGVDINSESVEISKLSLWLKTANKQKKLTNLKDHIKQGNSLIDDPKVAGNLAFDWNKEFPEIMKKGGFDIVVGNPPYVRQELFSSFKPYFEKKYHEIYHGMADLFVYFLGRGKSVLKNNGMLSYIIPNKWMRAGYGEELRKWLKKNNLSSLIDFGDLPVFSDATTYPCILAMQPENENDQIKITQPESLNFSSLSHYVALHSYPIAKNTLSDKGWSVENSNVTSLLDKIKSKGIPLGEYVDGKIFYGIKTGLNDAFVIDQETKERLIKEDPKSEEIIKPFLAGREVKRYHVLSPQNHVLFTRRGIDIEKYPAIKNYLTQFKERLEPRPKDWKPSNLNEKWSGRKPGSYQWYEIQDNIAYYQEFEKPKILLPDISKTSNFTIDEEHSFYCANTAYIISSSSRILLSILNSKLALFFYTQIASTIRGGYLRFIYQYLIQIPIYKKNIKNPEEINTEYQLENFVKNIITNNNSIHQINTLFNSLLHSDFTIKKTTKNLKNWH